MSDTSTVNLTSGTSSTSTSEVETYGNSTLGKNEFLTILTTQLQYQDPTDPMDNSEFVAQLAQFSSLEQMQNMNTTLEQLVLVDQAAAQNSVVSMVGKDALFTSAEHTLTQDGSVRVSADLASDAADVIMTVSTTDGTVVRRQSFGALNAGVNELTWDGYNDDGDAQEPGTYLVSVAATDLSGESVEVTQQQRARITGVEFEDGAAQLLLGDKSVPLSEVQQIQESSTTTP